MNERIKELEERCWEELGEEECYYTVFNREKFAELIVRECADVCRDDGRWFQEQDDKVEAGVAYALCYKIKENFGIEE